MIATKKGDFWNKLQYRNDISRPTNPEP